MMRAIPTQATVAPDGSLRIELPAGKIDALVVLSPLPETTLRRGAASSGLFRGRLNADLDVDAALREIRRCTRARTAW